ncbi:Uu.00g095590.m01.CDS01 [Anthostomella pinea]|uniref:Uu.00g095590.m01.CDS01 n=1 Tax=Anthostomella pinea TaxID=933095 RepID=A0AAI8VD21_9PEZI|nr:Uu.00g095590.m01.CDS01 [Anthostomella pinea]
MATKLVRGRATRILVLNPNSSQSMTDGMEAVVHSIDLPYSTEIYTYTGPPDAPASINDGHDIQKSTEAVLGDLGDTLHDCYQGIVVACFSVHPLVPKIQSSHGQSTAVTGIFEASILAAMSLLGPGQQWGILTTGKFWEEHLADGVNAFLGVDGKGPTAKFAGVESTGLNASDFHHGVDPVVVREKLITATKRLLQGGNTTCIVMGCAGMAGLKDTIRTAAKEQRGEHFAYVVLHVIDGVRAGIMEVERMIRHQRQRRG